MFEVIVIGVVWVISMFISTMLIDVINQFEVNENDVGEVSRIPFYILGPIGVIILAVIYLLKCLKYCLK